MSLIPYISYFKRPDDKAVRPIPPRENNTCTFTNNSDITNNTIYAFAGFGTRGHSNINLEKLAEKSLSPLNKLLSLFEKNIQFSSSELTSIEKCKELAVKIEPFLKLASVLFEYGSGEEKTIKECRKALEFYSYSMSEMPNAFDKGISEEILRMHNVLLPEYFDWVADYLKEKDISVEKDLFDKIEQMLSQLEVKSKSLKPFEVGVKPPESKHPGKVEKEKDEGNDIYFYNICDIRRNGFDPLVFPSKDILLQPLSSLEQRKAGEIDIEIPIAKLPNIDGKTYLYTHLGFVPSAIELKDNLGRDRVPIEGIQVSQDFLGITSITDLPPDVETVRYRLIKKEIKPFENIPEEWTEGIEIANEDARTHLIKKMVSQTSGNKEKVMLLAAFLQEKKPAYTTNEHIQKLLAEAYKQGVYFEMQEAIGFIGKCDHHSATLINKAKLASVPALTIEGLSINEHSGNSLSTDFNVGHMKTLYLDDNKIPQTFESTGIVNPKEKVQLDEAQIKSDFPKALELIKRLPGRLAFEELQRMGLKWKEIPNKKEKKSDIQSPQLQPSSIPSGSNNALSSTGYVSIQDLDKTAKDKPDEYLASIQECYLSAAKKEKLILDFNRILEIGSSKEILEALDTILKPFVNGAINVERYRGNAHSEISNIENEVQRCQDSFIQWLNKNSPKAREFKDEVLSKMSEYYYSSIRRIVLQNLSPEDIMRLDGPDRKKTYSALSDLLDNENITYIQKLLLTLKEKGIDQNEISSGYAEKFFHKEVLGSDDKHYQLEDPHEHIRCINVSKENLSHITNGFKLLSEKDLKNFLIEVLKLSLKNGSPDSVRKVLKACYDSGRLEEHLEIVSGKIVCKGEVKRKLEEHIQPNSIITPGKIFILAENPIENNPPIVNKYDFGEVIITDLGPIEENILEKRPVKKRFLTSELPTLAKLLNRHYLDKLEEMGLDIKGKVNKGKLIEEIRNNYYYKKVKDFPFNIEQNKIDSRYPVRLLSYMDSGLNIAHNFSTEVEHYKEILHVCKYFDLPLTEVFSDEQKDESELWETSVKKKFMTGLDSVLSYLENLNKESLILFINELGGEYESQLKEFVYLSNATLDSNQNTAQKCFYAVCERSPEAKAKFEEKIRSKAKSIGSYQKGQIITELVLRTVGRDKNKSFAVANQILKSHADYSKLKADLKAELISNHGDVINLNANLKRILYASVSEASLKDELRNELANLNSEEIRMFATLIVFDYISLPNKDTPISSNVLFPEVSNNMHHSVNYIKNVLKLYPDYIESLSGGFKKDVPELKQKEVSYELLGTYLSRICKFENEVQLKNTIDALFPVFYETAAKKDLIVALREVGLGYKRIDYRFKENPLLKKIDLNPDNSFWSQRLINKLITLSPQEELEMLSTGGACFDEAEKLSKILFTRAAFSTTGLFRNGKVSFIKRIGPSSLFASSSSGAIHSFSETLDSVDVRRIAWKQQAKRDSGRSVIKNYIEETQIEPNHYVVNLEWLGKDSSKDELSKNLKDLITILATGLENRKIKQHVHLFYKGNLLLTLNPNELREMLSPTLIKDDLGERSKRTDFILTLNCLAKCAAQDILDTDRTLRPISNTHYDLKTKGGTVVVCTDDVKEISDSMSLFSHWLKDHFDVGVVDLKAH